MSKTATYRAKIIAEKYGLSLNDIGENKDKLNVNDVRYALCYNKKTKSNYDSQKPDEIRKMTPMQRAVLKSMTQSLLGSAQATNNFEVDITDLVSKYDNLKKRYKGANIKLSYTAIFIKAMAMALEKMPQISAQYVDENTLRIPKTIDIGCAVDVPDGLIVPVIRNANKKDLRSICIELNDIVERSKTGSLTSDDFGNASMSITNLGMYNVTYSTPILNSPESLILGTGAIIETVRVKNGVLMPVSIINFSLTTDHRIIKETDAIKYMEYFTKGLMDFKWT